jgi:HSP20 family protein
MKSRQELQVQQKREVDKTQESTIPLRMYLPVTDIFETDRALTVVLEMPGVNRESVDISVEKDVLRIEGRIEHSQYQDLKPVYTEYNIGNYTRSFQLPNVIDQKGITAELKDGVMTLMLPKVEKARPWKIEIA